MSTNSTINHHQVLCCLTQEEYEELRKDTNHAGRQHPPLLFGSTKTNGDPIFEDDITLIVRDILIKTSNNEGGSDELHEKDRDSFDASQLPFLLKRELIETAKNNWDPPRQVQHNHEPSYWHGTEEDAHNILNSHPELRNIFNQPPEQIAAAWTARQTRARK